MNKVTLFSFLLFFVFGELAVAQPMEGVITYTQTQDWARIYARLDFISQEEKDRVKLSWGAFSKYETDMTLVFDANRSLYTYASIQPQEGMYSQKRQEYVISRDFSNNVRQDWIGALGRVYHVEDSISKPKWKIMNKIKDVQGYVCMMAVTEDTVRGQKITAWFADGLPVPVGPGTYCGLPGAILELDINEGDIVLVAKAIELRAVGDEVVPKGRRRARKITGKGLDDLLYKHINDNIKARRYPYSAVPFL